MFIIRLTTGIFLAVFWSVILYSAYISFKSDDFEDDKHWLTFFFVFATFQTLECVTFKMITYFPLYGLLKYSVLGAVALPGTEVQTFLQQALFHQQYPPIPTLKFSVGNITEKDVMQYINSMQETGSYVALRALEHVSSVAQQAASQLKGEQDVGVPKEVVVDQTPEL
eukprot:TRINITY_DN1974_c0_g3_i3.p1 TRINITY_DN1974_c0_g3~~TRINITY_DN1974_c0_g3_i3.p1  ORF type:complete len:168 (-),score=17.13 TRINITY_DN1974_c0_g3_i3:309-812(-)